MLDNQWVALYGAVTAGERKPSKGMNEALGDLRPKTLARMQRIDSASRRR